MKNLFIIFFLSLTFNCFGQSQLQIKESYPDSLSVLNDCKWQLSKAKYRDLDGSKYDVFLDIDLNEVFMIFRKQEKYVKVILK